jgi:hypothetical protein
MKTTTTHPTVTLYRWGMVRGALKCLDVQARTSERFYRWAGTRIERDHADRQGYHEDRARALRLFEDAEGERWARRQAEADEARAAFQSAQSLRLMLAAEFAEREQPERVSFDGRRTIDE